MGVKVAVARRLSPARPAALRPATPGFTCDRDLHPAPVAAPPPHLWMRMIFARASSVGCGNSICARGGVRIGKRGEA